MQESNLPTERASALVVGLCAHGLALVRALARAGIAVTALERDRNLPGFRTRYATVRAVADINGPGLIDALNEFAATRPGNDRPVLFLTNDHMVRIVGRHWDALGGRYHISWSHCREQVLHLIDKASLEAHCAALGLPYPKSRTLATVTDLESLSRDELAFPLIVKPTQPLSSFKVRLIEDLDDLRQLATHYGQALPFLLQEWIPGDDRQLVFCSLYLSNGTTIAAFEGQKLQAIPPAMGQGTIMAAKRIPGLLEISERFFKPLGLSGPVSLEFKLDPQGNPWIIEPNVGRTEYSVDCAIANGVNFPLLEYARQTGLHFTNATQRYSHIWFDTERAPFSYLRFRLNRGEPAPVPWRARFPYWGHGDPAPFYQGLRRFFRNSAARVWRRLTR